MIGDAKPGKSMLCGYNINFKGVKLLWMELLDLEN